MKHLLLAFAFALTISSCRHTTETTLVTRDTVRTPDPTKGGWKQPVQLPEAEGLLELQFTSPTSGFAVGELGSVYHSTDSGSTWGMVAPTGGGASYACHFFDSTEGVVCGDISNLLFLTANGGRGWSIASISTTGKLRGIKFFDRSLGFALSSFPAPNGSPGGITRSTDAGQSWGELVKFPEGGLYGIDCADRNNWIVTGKQGTILVSHDAGVSWKRVESGETFAQIVRVKFVGKNTAIAVGGEAPSFGIILRSTDMGETWTKVLEDTSFVQALATNSKGLITAAGWAGNIWESKDGGITWDHTTPCWWERVYCGEG
jgi:photosystem II stability/assembly factor-like uncharacterized protein